MIIDQVTASIFTDADDFISDETFATMLLYNVTTNISKLSNSDTWYGNIKL